MSKKLLFNLNKNVSQDYTYVKYTGTIVTATNTLEKPIKNAILKGDTKYRDVDTGEILDSFDGTKNLELVSVKTPVLRAVGKNLVVGKFKVGTVNWNIPTFPWFNNGELGKVNRAYLDTILNLINGKTYTLSCANPNYAIAVHARELGTANKNDSGWLIKKPYTFKANNNFSYAVYVRKINDSIIETQEELAEMGNSIMLEEGSNATAYVPYKTNILTVNEEVILRSNGDVYDELNVLTGKLIQRISEDGEVLSEEITKTVTLNIVDQDENEVSSISSFNDTTHIITSSETISPVFEGYIATKESVE